MPNKAAHCTPRSSAPVTATVRRRDEMKRLAAILIVGAITRLGFAQTNASSLEQRLASIIIPSIEFRDANPFDALSFLCVASTLDPSDRENIQHLSLIQTNTPETSTSYAFEFEDGTPVTLPSLTADYRHITVHDAIAGITKQLGLTYSLEDNELAVFKDGKRIRRKESVDRDRDAPCGAPLPHH